MRDLRLEENRGKGPWPDRNSEQDAQKIVQSVLPQPETRETVLQLLTDSIVRAHKANRNGWSITLHHNGFTLNAGRIFALSCKREDARTRFRLSLDNQSLTDEVRERLQSIPVSFEYSFKAVPGAVQVRIPVEHLARARDIIQESYFGLIDRAAQESRAPWSRTHSPGLIDYLKRVSGVELPRLPSSGQIDGASSEPPGFSALFHEFADTYLGSKKGQEHLAKYEPQRLEGKRNYEAILRADAAGEEITDLVLLKLLPHSDTGGNRQRGAWLSVAPAVTKDIKTWFEGSGWTRPEAWPRVARAILQFVRRCVDNPEDLAKACAEFASLPYTKGFQTGLLTPILNALRPDDFMLINRKSRDAINRFTNGSLSNQINDYPELNQAGRALVESHAAEIVNAGLPDSRDCDVFDAFSHWLYVRRKRGQEYPDGGDLHAREVETELTDSEMDALFPPRNAIYSVEECSTETGIEPDRLRRWVRAIERKGQAIIYGPPGTGKTFLAHKLAQYLVGGGEGIVSTVQFHPAYAYEDFIQGIRPVSGPDGRLDYQLVPGRLLEFCNQMRGREGRSVLIIDEINRANLARVFGELMYLLEYRSESMALAGGGEFHLPSSLRIIGTMNTADRSIALVDHALRRRFAFIPLFPDIEVLRRYHQRTGFPIVGLIEVLTRLNQEIGDRHYEVGISFFLTDRLDEELEDIWRMEIEPYLEELFFDQPAKTEQFRWQQIRNQILP